MTTSRLTAEALPPTDPRVKRVAEIAKQIGPEFEEAIGRIIAPHIENNESAVLNALLTVLARESAKALVLQLIVGSVGTVTEEEVEKALSGGYFPTVKRHCDTMLREQLLNFYEFIGVSKQ